MPASMGDATAPALSHSPETPHLCNGMKEGRLLQHLSGCACSRGGNRQRNKRKLSEKKVDLLLTKQKWQRKEGGFKAIKYFEDVKEEKLTWSEIIFNNVKGGGG
jgi:hypothetical protein